jgi:ATP-dependent helicase/DNAse subunit B
VINAQKEFVYSHFRRLDEARIQKLQQLISEQERRLQTKELLVDSDEYNYIHRSWNTAKTRLTSILSESHEEKEERYAELHESMQSEHMLGLSDLDFTRTGL